MTMEYEERNISEREAILVAIEGAKGWKARAKADLKSAEEELSRLEKKLEELK